MHQTAMDNDNTAIVCISLSANGSSIVRDRYNDGIFCDHAVKDIRGCAETIIIRPISGKPSGNSADCRI
jgi:hypothetical protein